MSQRVAEIDIHKKVSMVVAATVLGPASDDALAAASGEAELARRAAAGAPAARRDTAPAGRYGQ